MDIIYLNELHVSTTIGVHPHERRHRQTIFIDLEMETDIKTAGQSDNLSDTLDYEAVANRLVAVTEDSSYYLLETLATQMANLILSEFKVSWLRLRLNKPAAIPNAKGVGIVIERSAD